MVTLKRQGDVMEIDWIRWGKALALAQAFGWVPEGTVGGEGEEALLQHQGYHLLYRSVPLSPDDPPRTPAEEARMAPGVADMMRHLIPDTTGYFSCDGGLVSESDAHRLADALERALPYIPGEDILAPKMREYPGPGGPILGFSLSQPVTAFELFSGERRKFLDDLIAFCRGADFVIW
jgi:hypothetical protein